MFVGKSKSLATEGRGEVFWLGELLMAREKQGGPVLRRERTGRDLCAGAGEVNECETWRIGEARVCFEPHSK